MKRRAILRKQLSRFSLRRQMKHPKRGEIWLIDFNPARGSEQSGQRPAVVIQNDVGNRISQSLD
ncbi:MAG: type II toxin-antitoxin system PemK/MazF family toxin [bacterium]